MTDQDFRQWIAEALETVRSATGQVDLQALFGDWIIDEPGVLSTEAARAAGLLEGAAGALDVTVLELLDAFNLE